MAEQTEIKSSPINHAMRSGLEVGFWMSVGVVLHAQGMEHPVLGVLASLVGLYVYWAVYVSTQHYKSTECEGKIKWAKAYRYVLCLYVCASLVSAIFNYAYFLWIDQAYLVTMYENVLTVVEKFAEGMDGGLIYDAEVMKSLFVPIRFAVLQMFSSMLDGVVFGALIALIASRKAMRYFDNLDKNNK